MSDRAVGPSHQMISCKLQFHAGFVKRAVSSWDEEVLKQDMLMQAVLWVCYLFYMPCSALCWDQFLWGHT